MAFVAALLLAALQAPPPPQVCTLREIATGRPPRVLIVPCPLLERLYDEIGRRNRARELAPPTVPGQSPARRIL